MQRQHRVVVRAPTGEHLVWDDGVVACTDQDLRQRASALYDSGIPLHLGPIAVTTPSGAHRAAAALLIACGERGTLIDGPALTAAH